MVHNLANVWCDDAEVLGDYGQVRESLGEVSEKVHGRSFNPFSVDGCFFGGRHFPIGHQSSEVVNSHEIV